MSAIQMFTCPSCEGVGWRLWFDRGRARFIRCMVCVGARTICWIYGATPTPTLVPHYLRGGSRIVLEVPLP